MRFLVLTQYFHPETGAPQVRLAAMIRELLRLGHTVEVVTALPNYPNGKIFSDYQGRFYRVENWEGVRLHRVWMYAATGAGFKRLLNYFSFMITALWGLRRAKKPDYLFVESPPLFLGITGYIAAKIWRVPFILNIADLWPDTIRALGLMQDGFALRQAEKLEAWLYRKANYVTVVTESVRQILINDKQVQAHKVLLLPNGVDTQLFQPQSVDAALKTLMNLPENQNVILYTGTHGYAHGMEVILQAAQLLSAENVLFLCVGGGSEKNRIQQLCEQKKLKNVLFWTSHPPEFINRLYSLALAGISSFRDSPLLECTRPAKTLAIMACGKPVLYSGAGEGAQLVASAKAGIITPPENPAALSEAIRKLIRDKAYATQLGHNGRIYVEKHLQWSTVVAAWLQQFKEG
ncbi:MAG: glycosyltransferase WbuB [Gammaproteobacteria bacterium]|nr:MAG: glycosyltransferase WbuB [Gammaproteobacteria bacterium]RKZ44125.1 MAG: glycosyltransferase WbuB [Gammaproteobacteria bacterium]RKZ73722.1 MAG: glycosyltransferase WbuB [Gammaproteobacteria bacterium]